MKNNPKKQYIILFKNGLRLLIVLLILLLFICINALFSVLSMKFYKWQNSPYFEIEKTVIAAFLTAIFSLGIKFVFRLDKMRKLSSKLYSFLCKKYLVSENPIICKLIENFICIFYKGNFLPVQEQMNLVQNILNDLREISNGNSASHLFIVTGDAHSGKTILAKKIINDIFTKEDYIHLFKRYSKSVFYYDFSCFQNQLEVIMSNYENSFYIDKIIVFDNIHKLNNHQINSIMKHIVRTPNNAKCIILLTRDISYMLEDDLIKEIEENEKNNLIKTENLSVLKFDNDFGNSENFSEFLNMINIDQELANNDFIKYHLFYIYHIYKQNKNSATKKFFKQFNYLNFTNKLVKGFVFICCCVLFTGIINEDILKKWLNGKSVYIFLNTYLEIGIINRFQGVKASFYTFHEKTAKIYISYICKQQAGLRLCKEYFLYLYENTEKDLKYRYSLPFSELYSLTDFDLIISNANFRILHEDINFIIDSFKLDRTHFERELGLLNDRLGSFLLTKECILNLYNQTKEAKHLITLLHADHMMYYNQDYHEKYKELTESNNLYLNFSSNYWIKHIEMHQGQWDIDAFIELCENLPNNLEYIAKQSYDNFHVLRRFYFDCIRIYYLQGISDYNFFNNLLIKLKFIEEYLETKLSEFKIYKYKFVYGHYIHYDMLFNFEILDKTPHKKDLEFANCINVSEFKKKAVDYYYKAYKAFKRSGDKTADYVLLRICELSPTFVLKQIFKRVENNIDLIELTTDDYYAITHIFDDFRDRCGIKENVLEYAAFAETYKLKFTLMCKLNCPNIEIEFDRIIDECASNAIEYHNKYNEKHSNQYGLVRIQMLKFLNNYLLTNDSSVMRTDIEKIKDISLKKNYNRELKLIAHIESLNYNISINKMRKIVSYYPIVLQ